MIAKASEHRFVATQSSGEVSAILVRPEHAHALYVFGHGAGAGMRHAFMEAAADKLAGLGVATFRYNFPFMEASADGRRRGPNHAPILVKTVRSAVAEAASPIAGCPDIALAQSLETKVQITKAA